MKLFDTHTHYDDEKFDTLGYPSREALIASLFESEVDYILGASVDLATSALQIDMASRFPGYYAAVGIHPENCGGFADAEGAIREIEKLAAAPKVKAIGEIGLDYYWEDNPSREVQQYFFEEQLALAGRLGLPVIVHDREAHGATLETLLCHPDVTGVLHSFSGSVEMARELWRRGWYISFSGVITFKNASRLLEVVKAVPADRILVETDCPYLSPVPMRGKVNHSGYVKYTAARAAELRGEDYEAFVEMTTENAKRLLKIG